MPTQRSPITERSPSPAPQQTTCLGTAERIVGVAHGSPSTLAADPTRLQCLHGRHGHRRFRRTRRSVWPPSLPAGITLDGATPLEGRLRGRTRDSLPCRSTRPEGGVAHAPTRQPGAVGSPRPQRRRCRTASEKTLSGARTFSECPRKGTTGFGRAGKLDLGEWCANPGRERILERFEVMRELGGRGVERDGSSSRRSEPRTRRRSSPDRPACGAR